MTMTTKILYTLIRWLYVMPIIRLIETIMSIFLLYIIKKRSWLMPFKIILNTIAYVYIFQNFHCTQKVINLIYI